MSPNDPSIDPLLALAEHAADFACKKFKDVGEVSPMIIADTADGHRLVVPTVLGSAEQKDAVSESLRAQFKAKGVVRYASMTEAWMVVPRSGQPFPGRPSTHPDRREVLLIEAGDKQGRTLAWTYFILRPEHRRPMLRGKKQFDGTSGRFANLLKPEA